MRISPLKHKFEQQNAVFSERFGTEIISHIHEESTEYQAIRNSVGLTDFSFMQKFRFPEETGIDFLDEQVAGNVAKVRFGRVLHTFLPDENGMIRSDCYIANNDDELIVLCESINDDSSIRETFMADGGSRAEDLTETHIVLGIDGYKSWEVARKLFGADVLGLPYLSIERYTFNDVPIRMFRGGKTSEFGYLLMAPNEIAEALFDKIYHLVQELDGCLCGNGIHDLLRLEGRFFNVFAEGKSVTDPLSLGLQWMIDFDKDGFPGYNALRERRSGGLKKKIIGIQASKGMAIETGIALFDGDNQVGKVEASCFSYILDAFVGLALLSVDVAYAGLTFTYGSPSGPEIKTISMPPIMPKSLTVKLDEM